MTFWQLFTAILSKTSWHSVTSLRGRQRKKWQRGNLRYFTLLASHFFGLGRMRYKSAYLCERLVLPGTERDYLNPLTTNCSLSYRNQSICNANQLNSFYIMENIGRYWVSRIFFITHGLLNYFHLILIRFTMIQTTKSLIWNPVHILWKIVRNVDQNWLLENWNVISLNV